MASAASIAFSRNPAPFERVRLFFGGTHWWLNTFGLLIAWPIFTIKRDAMFFAYAISRRALVRDRGRPSTERSPTGRVHDIAATGVVPNGPCRCRCTRRRR
jgi:hypothetical protein